MPPVNGTFCVTIMKDRCINARMTGKCATCVEVCPYDVYAIDQVGQVRVQNYNACVGCRICSEFCPEDAIRINPAESEFLVRS
ncbi:MAG: 4Fe-4S binding protein, partial [Candidatus Hadarchaeum sp.]